MTQIYKSLLLMIGLSLLITACSTPSAPPPNTPKNLSVAAGEGVISMSWEDTSNNETSFVIYRDTVSSATDTTPASTPYANVDANEIFFQDQDVKTGTFYRYAVAAKNAGGTSALVQQNGDALTPLPENNSPIVVVILTPPDVALHPGDTQAFTAEVSGTPDTDVTWTLTSGGGTIQASGKNKVTYTAPDAEGVYTLTATSVIDPSVSDSAEITVTQIEDVNALPVITSFTADVPSELSPLYVTFDWEISDADDETLFCELYETGFDEENYTEPSRYNDCETYISMYTPSYNYPQAGTYTADLYVYDESNAVAVASVTITVQD